jgi:peptidoglycan/LPS O-acetylase OafA/YrhL
VNVKAPFNAPGLPIKDLVRIRTDIQALRGLAILLVMMHHARLFAPLKAGYLGVDIFFVVSGYLITDIVRRGLIDGTFSFAAFYVRRAKRLLPAAYVAFAGTACLSAIFLAQNEMRDFAWQLMGAITFTGNVVLWTQTGYFEGSAYLKPLLHVWSLSLEEQYYLLLPAAMVFTPPRFWKIGIITVVLGSLTACLALVPVKPGAAFYLLPTRAWELALGSLGILVLEGTWIGTLLGRLFWPAIFALLLIPFFPTGAPHPGLDALIACSATLVLLLRRHPLLAATFASRWLARLGDISYPLYLVHWPLLAISANAWLTPVPRLVRVGLLLFSLLLAWALHRWVEQPARRAVIPVNPRSLVATLALSSVLGLTALAIHRFDAFGDQVDYAYVRRANLGLNSVCEYGTRFEPKPECQNSDKARIMVWGDSYAMHLVDGIAASSEDGVVQATKALCGPFQGIAVLDSRPLYGRAWAEGCLSFNRSVLQYLAASSSIEVVVLSSLFGQYLTGNHLVASTGSQTDSARSSTEDIDGGEDVAATSLRLTIASIRALGKRVAVVAPPPKSGFDIGRCLELKANHKLFFGADNPSCEISEAAYRAHRAAVLAMLERVARDADVAVLDLGAHLCRAGACAVEIQNTFLYRDGGHLSHDGSRLLGSDIALASLLTAAAR